MLSVLSNVTALNASNQLKINAKNKALATEKLSSGYRINRAADDAAGLAISEKMRLIIRSLNQGTQNGTDGISWCQTGDGALDEAQELLQRMNELAIKSLNGTNSDSDRSYMEMEFKNLKEEMNRIGQTTLFNEQNIFDEYDKPNYKVYGGPVWTPSQQHVVTEGNNNLCFEIGREPDFTKVEITVPAGEYSTQDLMAEIDMALFEASPDLLVEYKNGHCNAVLMGNDTIGSVTGGLSYLIYQTYQGGTFGALIGTTIFEHGYDRLEVVAGKNDYMSFSIEDFDGNKSDKEIKLAPGRYTRGDLIELLNKQLKDTVIEASPYGTGIKLGSESAMVTGFKGNMFKIDNKDESKVYNSVFYDNVQYGNVTKYPAVFTGSAVLPTDSRDKEHSKFIIDGSNNILILQPDGREDPVSITIDEGEYTIGEMREKLETLFKNKGLNLSVKTYSDRVRVSSRRYYYFQGLTVTSGLKGLESTVNFVTASSAYKTLFESRQYNDYGSPATRWNETSRNVDGYFYGSRTFPAAVTLDGSNHKFTVNINVNDNDKHTTVNKSYTVEMSQKTYANVEELKAELQSQLNKDTCPLKGLLDVTVRNGTLAITSAAGKDVNTIRLSSVSGNSGYDTLFVGRNSKPIYNSVNRPSVTLPTPIPTDGIKQDSNVTIQLGNNSQTVNINKGDDQNTIKQKIEAAFPPSTRTEYTKFPYVSGHGGDSSGSTPTTATGSETMRSWNGSATGSSKEAEGSTALGYNIPASLKIGPELKDTMVLDSGNNQISLNINGTPKTLTLTEGSYNPDSLVTELQEQIDKEFGTDMGGAIVEREGNNLIITARLPLGEDGKDTSLSCSTGSSSFLKDLNTTRRPAEWRSNRSLQSGININGANNQLSFQYTKGGNTETVTLTLDNGSYTPSSIIGNIQRQLDKTDTGIQAALVGGKLALTSGEGGSGVSISFTHDGGGSAADALFGPVRATPADIIVNQPVESTIKIDDSTKNFTIYVNGAPKTVTLDAGDYDREGFKNMLNEKLEKEGVEAYLTNNRLGFRTTQGVGSNTTLAMNYDNGGSSMERIYGKKEITIPGITVSFTADGRAQLSSTDNQTRIYMNTSSGGALMQPEMKEEPITPSYNYGYHSQSKSYLDGQNLKSAKVTIDKWNDDLKFTYHMNGSQKTVTIQVPGKDEASGEKEYTYDELKDYLQGEVDRQVGAGQIKVTVDASGVRFEAANTGNGYQFDVPTGDFYDKVMCQCEEMSVNAGAGEKKGYQEVDQAFTVGRQDVKNTVTTIKQGLSDEFSLDLTYDGKSHTVKITLDPGDYTGEQLKNHLQQKFDQALADMGLKPGLIKVGLGDKNTGVQGANDQNALSFTLAEDVSAPAEKQYIIDGASGNAAFKIFYKTDGEMIPSHIVGTKNIANGASIGPNDTDFFLKVDGVPHTLHIPQGTYTAEEILDTVNQLLKDDSIPVVATQEGNFMMLSHKNLGKHTIEDITGGAKDNIFFREEREDAEEPRNIWLSNEPNDKVPLPKETLSTWGLRLHASSIAKPKYAKAAVNRISYAINQVSQKRTDFGVTQNRLEHALRSNENKAENTQSSESLIRDTDMAREMVRYANLSVLEQSVQSMLAQANKKNETVLALL